MLTRVLNDCRLKSSEAREAANKNLSSLMDNVSSPLLYLNKLVMNINTCTMTVAGAVRIDVSFFMPANVSDDSCLLCLMFLDFYKWNNNLSALTLCRQNLQKDQPGSH